MLIFAFLLVFSPMAAAQEQEVDPGITPDSPLYGLDRAWETVRYNAAKISGNEEQVGLEIAREKLAENKKMLEEGKTEEAEEAMQNAERINERVRKRVEERGENMPSLDEIEKGADILDKAKEETPGFNPFR